MAACPTIDPAIGTAQTLIASVNCYVETSVAQSYGALMGPGGGMRGALTAALVIYVAILGYRFMLGRARLSVGDLVPRMLMIGAILALTTSWATYQTLVYDVLTDGPEELAGMVTRGQAPAQSVAQRVDRVSKQLTDVANDWGKGPLGIVAAVGPQSNIADAANAARARAEANGQNPMSTTTVSTPTTIGANPFSSAPNYLSWSAMLLTLTAAGSVAIAKALLGLLLALGPAFALFALFDNLRGLAVGWARAVLFLAFVPLLATLTSLAMLAMLEPMATRLAIDAGRNVWSLNSALAIFIAVLVMTGIALLAVRVAGMMVSGWVISFKDQMANVGGTNENRLHEVQTSNGALSGGMASMNQPRLDQMVQAIKRSNSVHVLQQTHTANGRLNAMAAPQLQRPAAEATPSRVRGLLPNKAPASLSSPLRPARSWS
ncbi:MAG: type IV secretion system protein [Sphingorhabdus sp.]